jgi:hypothetical protein
MERTTLRLERTQRFQFSENLIAEKKIAGWDIAIESNLIGYQESKTAEDGHCFITSFCFRSWSFFACFRGRDHSEITRQRRRQMSKIDKSMDGKLA